MDQKPPRSIAEVWKLLHMTNDKLEYFERRQEALEEDVKALAKEVRSVEKSCDNKIDMVEKQITAIRITLAQWLGMGIVIFTILQALTVAIITHYMRNSNESLPAKIVQK
jgi:glutaredoxin 2